MLAYHGTTTIVKEPKVDFSMRNLDFGVGFYLTQNKTLAEKWARCKKDLNSKTKSILNIYELDCKYTDSKYLLFEKMDKKWLDFVCDCRNGLDKYKEYEIIEGPIANDKVFTAVDFYRKGLWDVERTIKELSFVESAIQICFINQNILDKYLKFKESVEV